MKIAKFVSRHAPTPEQVRTMHVAGYSILHVGDVDAFDIVAVATMLRDGEFSALICVHPVIALSAIAQGIDVVVFKNENRAAVGHPVEFRTAGCLIMHPSGASEYVKCPDM